jgi:hypothetical protein
MKFKHKFLHSFILMTFSMFILSTILIQIVFAILLHAIINLDWIIFIGIVSIIWCLPWSLFLYFLFKITINENGIRCYNFWGVFRTCDWNDIVLCKYINFSGFKYIRIYSKDKYFQLWLPLFLHDFSIFINEVENLAGNDNELTKILRGTP